MSALPHSRASEAHVIGAAFVDPSIVGLADLGEDAFFVEQHRAVWRVMRDLRDRGAALDEPTVGDELRARHELAMCGGRAGVAEMVGFTAANWEHHARVIRRHATLRAVIRACEETALAGHEPDVTLDDLQAKAERDILGAFTAGASDEPLTMNEVMDRVDAGITARQNGTAPGRLLTGFRDLDQILFLGPGDLVVLAGDASHGKTALALDVAENVARRGERVLLFSLEMLAQTLGERRLAGAARIELTKLRSEPLDTVTAAHVRREMGGLRSLALRMDERSGTTLPQVASQCRRQALRWGKLSLVIVDYLQLMGATDRGVSRERQVGEISTGLKALAKELGCVVLLLSSLNRDRGARRDGRPTRANLRDSGQIEFDADTILFVYREEVANPDTERKNVADVIVDKQRNGPLGEKTLTYLAEWARFADYSPRQGGGW